MGNVETPASASSDDSGGAEAAPSKRNGGIKKNGMYGAFAGICAVTAVLSLVALSGGQRSPQTADAAAQQELQAAAAKPAVAKPAAAKPAAAPNAASGTTVMIENYAFSPASLTVKVGTTVTWMNMDSAPHTVTVSSGPVKFNSPNLQKGDVYTYTFKTAGTYSYYCAVHPDMTAKVVVTGATPTPTSSAPAPTPTTSTPAPSPTSSSPNETCTVSTALQTFLTHLNAAHLSEGPAQQLQDISNVDQYIKMHMVLVQNMLAPLTEGGLTDILSGDLTTFLLHLDSAHLSESPAQQAQDILDLNQYLASHMVLIEHLLEPIQAEAC
jgi:plastocyanin